jgi:ketosteroid isomerase-like protein
MTRTDRCALALLGAAALAGCGAKVDVQAEEARLMETSRSWSKAAEARDLDRVMGYFADDAKYIAAGRPMAKGRADIRRRLDMDLKMPGFAISWRPLEAHVSASGDLGYLVEITEIKYTDLLGRNLSQRFNAVTIWRRQEDGARKNVVDISAPQPL